jgi:hypothetical protein
MRGGLWADIVDTSDSPERASDHRLSVWERAAQSCSLSDTQSVVEQHGSQARCEEAAQAQAFTGTLAFVAVDRVAPAHSMPAIADLVDLQLAYLAFKRLYPGQQPAFMMMMMSFICSCRNKNQPKDIPQGDFPPYEAV